MAFCAYGDTAQAQVAVPEGFVYVLGAVGASDGPAAIEGYLRTGSNGRLTRIGRFLTGGRNGELAGGQQHGLVRDGNRVYAVNTGSNTVSVMSADRDGRLTLLQQISSGGLRPGAIAIHGSRLYVNNAGHLPDEPPGQATVIGYNIRANGTLVRTPCAPGLSTPGELGNVVADIAISPSGNALITTGLLSDKVDSFSLGAEGCLTKRAPVEAGGGGFSAAFRPNSNNVIVTRAQPEVFGEVTAPGIGSFTVNANGRLTLVGEYIDPDKSDDGLRDPCWTEFADDTHFWVGGFIPRSITAFRLNANNQLTRMSEHHPNDTIPDPSIPGARLIVGAFDIAADTNKTHLYQIRGVGLDGNPDVPRTLHAFEVTGNFNVSAGLRETQVVTLPEDTRTRGVPGLVFVDRPAS